MTDHDDLIDRAVEELRRPVSLSPGFTERVMASIAADLAPEPTVRPRWWQRRWTVEITPLSGLAAAAALAAIGFGLTRLGAGAPRPVPAAVAAAEPADQLMQFVLVAPNAKSVAVVGDFNDWNADATPLVRAAGDRVWWVSVRLSPGRYRYAFVVDGTVWQRDPEAAAVEDEFGRPNSVVTIGGA